MYRKICFIDGSPRTTNSLSMYFIERFSSQLKENCSQETVIKVIKVINSYRKNTEEMDIQNICEYDTLVWVTPLYFDGLPSHLVHFMEKMYQYRMQHKSDKQISVYMCINSGFLDSLQSKNAISILKSFTEKIGTKWCGAISVGGGELFKVDKQSKKPDSKLMKPVFDGLDKYVEVIKEGKEVQEDNNTILVHETMGEKYFRIYANIGQIFIARDNKIKFKKLWAK